MSPALDQDLCLEQRIEDLAIEKLGAEFPVERFDIAILPRASGPDERTSYQHALTQLPYALLAAAVSAVGYLLVA